MAFVLINDCRQLPLSSLPAFKMLNKLPWEYRHLFGIQVIVWTWDLQEPVLAHPLYLEHEFFFNLLPCFKKIEVGLWSPPPTVCLHVYPSIFARQRQVKWIPPFIARQRLGKHVPLATNGRIVVGVVLYAFYVVSKQNLLVCLCIPLPFPGNGSVKTFPLQWRIVGGFIFFAVCVVSNSSQNLFKGGYSTTLSIEDIQSRW
jgi:hypothetical protein